MKRLISRVHLGLASFLLLGSAVLAQESNGSELRPSEPATSTEKSGSTERRSSAGALLEDGRRPNGARSLPALNTRMIGLHIGGKVSTEQRAAILRLLAQTQPELLRCYRQAERPTEGGTYGIDLKVALKGGHPVVQRSRQKLGSAAFQSCVETAFTKLSFPAADKPLGIAYAFRFEWK